MSNPGEWIDFAELCRRVRTHGLAKSPRTLRRYCKDRLISYRQACRRGRVEFNWRTVERELRAMDTRSTVSALAALPSDYPPDLVGELVAIRGELAQLRAQFAARFAGEQPKAAVG